MRSQRHCVKVFPGVLQYGGDQTRVLKLRHEVQLVSNLDVGVSAVAFATSPQQPTGQAALEIRQQYMQYDSM